MASKLEELINKYCTNGVEYKTIQDICDITRGRVISKNALRDNAGEYPVYSSQTLNDGIFGKINTYDFDGEYIQWTTDGANAGSIFYRNGKFSVTNVCGLLNVKDTVNVSTSYLAYYLETVAKKYVNYASNNPKLMSNVMANIKVAVPPMEVQCEIVHILDDFTLLSAELSAELKARQEQYEYFKNKIINFYANKENTEWKKLSEFAQIYDGTHQTPKYTDEGISFISVENINDIYGSNKYISKEAYNKYKIKPEINDIFMTRIGTIGKCAVYDKDIDLAYYVSLALIRPNTDIVISKYLKYVIEASCGRDELRKRTLLHAVPIKINKNEIGMIKLPIPSLEEQKKIVNVLDKFDKLTNDISDGLPAEIEARRIQYEYYRDKILNFKELK